MNRISIDQKFNEFTEQWRPKTIAELNGQQFKLIKVQGTFPWHRHEVEDELFIVWRGVFRVEFRDSIETLREGDMIVVPAGTEHRTAADEEAEVLCFEPAGMRNTGNIVDQQFTAPDNVKI